MSEHPGRWIVCASVLFVCPWPGAADDGAAAPPPMKLFAELDVDKDGALRLEEALPTGSPAAERRQFFLRDGNGDGVLSAEEWTAAGDHRTAANLFRGYDADGDGAISATEWLAGLDEAAGRKADQTRIVFDTDGNGSLSLEEIAAIPGELPLLQRGPVPDPIVVLAEECAADLLELMPLPAPAEQWCAQARGHMPASVPCQAALWDANGDGSVDESEVRRGVRVALGLIRADGGTVRHPNGLSYHGRLMWVVDPDGDGRLNADEFANYIERTRETPPEFSALDQNGDGGLDLGEIDGAGLVRTDRVAAFLEWDSDLDGVLGWNESREHSPTYFLNLVEHLDRFDADASGALSLAEYLASPLGEFNRDWNSARTDVDADGTLNLAEYFPEQELFLSWLAAHYFSQLDENQDERLSVDEATFRIDLDQVPPADSFAIVDGNSNGTISLDEHARHRSGVYGRRKFFTRDADGDGQLSRGEWEVPEAQLAVTASNLLRAYDLDGSGGVTEMELLTDAEPKYHAALRQQLIVFDADLSGDLSPVEFARSPSLVPDAARGELDDPIAAIAADWIERLQPLVDPPATIETWQQRVREVLPEPIPVEAQWWNLNGDGAVDATEMETGVLIACGIKRAGGGLSRFGNGRVFNEHFYRQFDKDGDRVLTGAELTVLSQRLNRTAEQITALDADSDGRLEMAELDAGGLFQADVIREYLRWDNDRDGTVTAEEFTSQVRGYDTQIAAEMVPAFDGDHDGRINLVEFLASPLADGSYVASDRRRDADHDLAVSPQEFFPRGGLAFSGLAALYFDRLDVNGNDVLDRSECHFVVNLSRLPAKVAFTWFDADQDQVISLSEALGAESPEQLLHPRSQLAFASLDRNRDGGLVPAELSTWESLIAASEAERILREEVRPLFQKLDQESDGHLTETEWAAGMTNADAATIQARFIRADGDRDLKLDLFEYADHLGESRPTWPLFRDAIRRRVDALVQDLLAKAGDGRAVTAIALASESTGQFVVPNDVRTWDSDRNGELDGGELERGVGIAYGLRSPLGRPLREGRGRTFNARHFAGIDKDRDGFLATQEFTNSQRSAEQLAAEFAAADADHDGRISFEEALDVPWLWSSADYMLARLDPDKDQHVTTNELALKAQSWEKQVASWTFPAFDPDGNGSLSKSEFQLSPIAAPFAQWDRPLIDQDGNDRISFEEFHPPSQGWLRGLSAEFFAGLDRDHNGALTANEIAFTIDFKTAPLAAIFRKFDQNADGQLSVTETIEGRGKSTNHSWIMQTEDAFYTADTDRNGELSVDEFAAPETTVALLASGRPVPPKPRGGRRPAAAGAAADQAATESGWDTRMIVLIALNVLLVGGAAWFFLRAPAR